MSKASYITLAALIFLCLSCKEDQELTSLSEPNFITSDIDLFWNVYDSSDIPSSIDFQSRYVDKGTRGLKDYAEQKNLAPDLRSTLNNAAYRQYYNSVRSNTHDVGEAIELSRQAFLKLEQWYPETQFFNVYFLIGAMSAGGRISQNGLLIAVEMFSKSDQTDLSKLSAWHQNVVRNKKYLPSIVVHEFVHMQQHFQPRNSGYRTTLEQSILEGMADFITFYLLENQPFMNEHLHTYGDPKEQEIWIEFNNQKNLNFRNTEWLYSGSTTSNGHPADMGYYVGFKILESYSSHFSSTEEAIKAMLSTSNYEEIFTLSNYAAKFDQD